MRKTLRIALVCLLCLGMTLNALAAQESEGIVFSDTVLEQKVREALGKPEGPITPEDAARLDWLNADASQDTPDNELIHDISALRSFVNLIGVKLNSQAIKDISPLADLSNLREVWLLGNPVENLEILGSLTGLVKLGFDSGFRELPFLKNLTQLVELRMDACRALPPELSQLQQLETFCSLGGELSDISLLAQLPRLTTVDVSWNLVKDLTPLSKLPLTGLYIAGNPILDYSPLRDIAPNLLGQDFDSALILAQDIPEDPLELSDPNLEFALRASLGIQDRPVTLRDAFAAGKLELHHRDDQPGPITDISPLKDFVNLNTLNLEGQQVSDLSPLAGLTHMDWLNIRYNQVSDLTPLKGMTVLKALYAEGNPLNGLWPLEGLTSLRVLYLDRQGNDQTPLEALIPALEETNLMRVPDDIPADPIPMPDPALEAILRIPTGVKDRPITYRDAYRITEIQQGVEKMWEEVSDLTALSAFVNLERLMVFGSKVSDLSPLAGLGKLNTLAVDASKVSDLTPLSGLHGLGYLELSGNQITDLTPLQSLTGLGGLDVSHNKITDLRPLYGLQNLGVLRISHNLTPDASAFKDIAKNLKDKDFDPDKPMETDQPEDQPEGQSEGFLQPENPDKVIKFPDKVLEKRVREALNKPEGPITAMDVASLDGFLNLSNEWQEKFPKGSQITKLDGIEYFINLRSLDISWHKIKDIKKLSGLTQLEHLRAFGNAIQDVKPLANLVNLISLNLGGNKIKSVKPLAALTNLTELLLADNPIKDFSPLKDIYPKLQNKDFEMK
ncbi:MAG: leucine-rich repeat domain-containing protein [Candidatus Limiplasma sp.]|nr:leucine-rich repeat domain-containing protein [Candidatus Limiplasma sp.]